MDPHADGSLSILTSNKRAFEVLTSDRGQRVIASLVKQWEADKYSDNGRSLWAVVETFFTKLPYVFVKEDEMNSKALLRYVSALATLKDVIVQALFCTNPSAAMAISATLMPTHNEKIPLYWYCHQLEREIQMLKNSTSDQSWEMVHSSDIGLLQQATAQALLTFWKLPKRERIAFLAQVFSNVTEIEADLVRVLLENNTFILQQVLEELGYQEKIAINKPKMSTVGAVVAMSLQVSNQARQLNKWRNRAKGESLEPIQVRHKGIQVNNTIEGEDVLGALEPLNVQLPNRIRRSVIPGDKGFQVVLMQDYQPFTRRDQTHLLAKDMWTVSTHTESLIHHLSLFIDSSREIKSVPPDVITLATLLLEWLHFERAKANSNAKDLTLEVFDNAHFKQCIVALMDLLKGQPESHVPDNIKWLAASLQGFVLRLQNQLPNSDSTSIPRAEASTATPADLRALLKHGFPSEIVNQILSISNEKQTKERESKIIILIEQLQQYLVDKFHRTFAKEANTPVGFGEVSSTQQQPITTSPVLKTLLDQMKCLLFDGSDGQLDEEQAASLMLEFLGSFEQRKNEKDSGGDLVKMLTIESLGNLFEKKVELQLLFGPLDKTTRSHIAKLQNFINKLLPENVSCTNLPKPTLSVTLKPNLIAELCTLVDEALAKKDVFGEKIAVTLETLKQDNPNTTAFIDFVYDWYLRKYGLRKLAMQHLSKLLLSLKKQKKKSKKALLFCRFLGLFPPLFDYSALNFALGLLNVWTNGTFTVSAAMTRVSLSAMNQILEDGYDRRFGPFCSTVLVKERLTRNACVSDPTSIEQDVALEIALDEFVKMKVNVESMLEDIYKAGDVNEDDAMGFDEFATVVRNLAPCVSDREIVKMFKEALLDSSFETITKNRFVNVIIDQGVLSSRVNKFKAPTGANSATFPEYEKEQFELLEETWRAHEAEIIKTIEQIPHKETSSSLLLRVRILNMIISKRIDSETAWLSHRMIIRDMERFKDLNESAISEIKKKEAFFKEAVTRITTSKFGLFGDNSKRPQGTTAISQTSPPPINSGVVQYVEQLGEHDEDEVDTDEANETDIARIEDSLRSEMLNLADAKCDTPIETQLNLFDDAVKKVRRLSMSRASKAITKLTSAMKKMGRNSGTLLTPAPAPTQKPEHSDSADDGDEDDDVSF
ncbi:unnamed protein product [Aphanomyces euteiches]